MLRSYWTPRHLEGKTTTTKPSLFFDLILMSRLTWKTEKELEREIKNKGDKISLETQHEQF